jgi:hypothetical protein
MVNANDKYRQIAQDTAASRVYQAYERLQRAWYMVNAQRPANGSTQFNQEAINELEAAEQEWLMARATASGGC